ncbi:MAG: pyrroloquinoline quinone-dependent dehydrogenase, partial [Roseibacillus sp.]
MKTRLPAVLIPFSALIWTISIAAEPKSVDWPVYLGGKERNLYSPLAQINRRNVKALKMAWSYDTGQKAEYQANNLIVRGVLYTPIAT